MRQKSSKNSLHFAIIKLENSIESSMLPFLAAESVISSGGSPVPPSFQYGFSSNLCKPA